MIILPSYGQSLRTILRVCGNLIFIVPIELKLIDGTSMQISYCHLCQRRFSVTTNNFLILLTFRQ